MTSKERVLSTINGKSVDRVASNFRAEAEVYQKLRVYLHLPDDEAVRVWAKSDFRDLSVICNTGGYGGYNSFGWTDKPQPDGSQQDPWGVRRKLVDYGQGTYIDIVSSPLKRAQGMDDLRKYEFPDAHKLFNFAALPAAIDAINAKGSYFTMIEGESLHDRCWAMRGIEEFMVDMMADEEAALFQIEGNFKFFMEYTKMILEAAGGGIDCIGVYNDLGNQRGMMISPALYRKYFKEKQRQYMRMVKGFGARVFYHSCGGITDILEDLIEIGVDIMDPLQLNAMGLTPEQLSQRVAGRMALHGGLSMQNLLVHGTPDEVRAAAQNLKRTLGRHGKYILSCSHLIQMDVPVANIQAVTDEVN